MRVLIFWGVMLLVTDKFLVGHELILHTLIEELCIWVLHLELGILALLTLVVETSKNREVMELDREVDQASHREEECQ